MSIQVAIRHRMTYAFDRLVSLSPHVLRVRPAPYSRTNISAYSLTIRPGDHFINWQQDPHNNYLARLVFPERARELSIEVEVIADMVAINPFDFFLEEDATDIPFTYDDELSVSLAPYRLLDEKSPLLDQWIRSVDLTPTPTIDFLVALNQRLAAEIDYIVRLEPGVQTCEETLRLGRGSCRDSAWLLAMILRRLGLASRFVSGYLVQLKADVESLDGPSGPDEDFSDLHAWTEVYLPGAGWVGLDPTSGLFASEGHIPLAATPTPAEAAVVEGATSPCEVEFSYANTVVRLHEDPRVTLPYTERQWQDIESLGHHIDAHLAERDVRLTMGGEPTFVSIDDFESAQWNTAADGPDKRAAADRLVGRLHEVFAPGGLLHHGIGKWYPGEVLPRWALNLFWRRDGEALWQEPALLAALGEHGIARAPAEAHFASRLAARLGIEDTFVIPAFEDTYYYLWREGRLPFDVDPADNRLKDPTERERIRRLFDRGLNQTAGNVLPLARAADGGWRSGSWPLKRGQLYLIPGDSPLGLRLPYDALPERGRDAPTPAPDDPFSTRRILQPGPWYRDADLEARRRERAALPPGIADDQLVRTALCTEIREGRLHVFLPPVNHLEDYVELIAAVEATAAELDQPVVIEGYEPPRDERLRLLQVTPDPGVIEVNVHPSSDWNELCATTETLYEVARECRLGTEKFMIDGRHTGTGGGNHVTLGGPTAADSPLLRRPDVLASLLRFWQNHPSLSYLFSGLFIGPTSQAPRADEARDDRMLELETALMQIPPPGSDTPPWLVDRVLRHLLTDLSGNTHRAEFCIDKLYSPDGSAGRRGLLEFRAFEMPPHAQMSLTQMLLLRGLVASFWEQPYEQPLIRWGTQLHDRFMLPWFVWHDFEDVMGELGRRGYDFDSTWYKPFFEFRFPRFGSVAHHGMNLTLRTALEPWHVLGEEQTGGGTARYVDSSVERLEVEVSGFVPERFAIACNGHALPLAPTGTRGNYVAGVRFKAWAPPSALHPTIPDHGPLTFDIVDRYLDRSVGGCRYHVSHPGGRSHEDFPVNARAAETRRLARFESIGHRQGSYDLRPVDVDPDMPFTLDLRRAARHDP